MAFNANPILVNHMRVMRRDSHAERYILLTILLKSCLEVSQSNKLQSTDAATPIYRSLKAVLY